ncbi:hypothetical protein NQZ68_027166, partial [Dissostichus eleginoides]
ERGQKLELINQSVTEQNCPEAQFPSLGRDRTPEQTLRSKDSPRPLPVVVVSVMYRPNNDEFPSAR